MFAHYLFAHQEEQLLPYSTHWEQILPYRTHWEQIPLQSKT